MEIEIEKKKNEEDGVTPKKESEITDEQFRLKE